MSLIVSKDGSVYCELCGYGAKLEGGSIFRLLYKVGEIVAVAQSYNSFYNDECNPNLFPNGAGWTNKMYVKPELMPHQIRITNVRAEQLQDISDEDCLKEGIIKALMECDMICLCPGWEKSKGCQLEHFAAKLWDKEIIEFERLKYSKIWKEK